MYMDGWIRMYVYVFQHTHTHTQTQPGNEEALLQAAEKGNTTTLVALLEAGTNANCRDVVCVCVCVCVRACNPKL